jgi:hypothetical protein
MLDAFGTDEKLSMQYHVDGQKYVRRVHAFTVKPTCIGSAHTKTQWINEESNQGKHIWKRERDAG